MPDWPLDATPLFAIVMFAVGGVAGFLNVVAGGGSLLTVPALIFAGLDPTVANGTSRLAIFTQNVAALVRFWRAGRVDTVLLRRLATPTLVGAAAGSYLATRLDSSEFRVLFGLVMLAAGVLVLVGPERLLGLGATLPKEPRLAARWVWPLMLLVGLYGGMIQAAVGYPILAALMLGLRLPLLTANIMKVVLVAVYTPIAVVIFIATDHVAWFWGILLAVGQSIGAWVGAGAIMTRGAGFIRLVLVVMVVVGALELLLG